MKKCLVKIFHPERILPSETFSHKPPDEIIVPASYTTKPDYMFEIEITLKWKGRTWTVSEGENIFFASEDERNHDTWNIVLWRPKGNFL